MKLTFVEEKTRTVGGSTFHLKEYSIGGYSVSIITSTYDSGLVTRRVEVREPWEDGSFLPKVYYHDDLLHHEPPRFEIQTTSYGALDAETFRAFLAAQQTAMEVVEVLNAELL
jgi:hypothetical protein